MCGARLSRLTVPDAQQFQTTPATKTKPCLRLTGHICAREYLVNFAKAPCRKQTELSNRTNNLTNSDLFLTVLLTYVYSSVSGFISMI